MNTAQKGGGDDMSLPPIKLWKQVGGDFYQYWHVDTSWYVEKSDWTEPIEFETERAMDEYFADLWAAKIVYLFGREAVRNER